MSDVDKEIRAVARISIPTWSIIITLIATVVGWGLTTLANSRVNDKQDEKIEKKVDKEDLDRQHADIMKRMDEINDNVKELRKVMIDDLRRHSRERR